MPLPEQLVQEPLEELNVKLANELIESLYGTLIRVAIYLMPVAIVAVRSI